MYIYTSRGPVMDGTLDNDRVCLIFDLYACYPVVMNVILFQNTLQQIHRKMTSESFRIL